MSASERASFKPHGTSCREWERSFFPQNFGLPEERLYPWEGEGGKWQQYWCGAGKRWRAPRQADCTLLWGVSSITRGLHGQADGLLLPNITSQCQETSTEGGKKRSNGNLLASTQRSCAAPKPSHRGKAFPIACCPMHSLYDFYPHEEQGLWVPRHCSYLQL